MRIPELQDAAVITRPGGPEVLEMQRVAVPEPRDDEVLIEVHAAGVNRHDCNQRRRGPTPAHSDIPGLEVAGVVVATGRRVAGRRVGDSVCALVDGGGYASWALAKAAQTLSLPRGLDFVAAAALPEAAFTVWHNFFRVASLGPGESVLLHGGTSGVGTLAIQVLSALGHPVFATCGSLDKVEAAQRLGARRAFSYRDDDYVAGVRAATQGRGVDVILDMSGGRHSARDVEALARRGRLVHLSPGERAEFRAPLRTLLAKEIKVTGSLLRPLPDDEKAFIAGELSRVVWPLVEAGAVRPVVHAVLPLAAACEAHRVIEAGQHIGKVVLSVRAER
jgi:putative PIG3 family NAD(P)H quinone oxidoreductase